MKELEIRVRRTEDNGYSATCEEYQIYFTARSIEDLKAEAGLSVGRAFQQRGEYHDVLHIIFTYEFEPLIERCLPTTSPRWRTGRRYR